MTDIGQQEYLDAAGAGVIEVVDLDDLNIDYVYQRALDHGLINRIAKGWDIAAAGAIKVGKRDDDTLWIIDGQHRAMAAKLAGESHILAQIIPDLNRAMEAEQRLKGNTRRTDTAQERFRAQVASENKESLAILELLKQFETTINYTQNAHTGLNCVTTIEALYRVDGGVMLSRVLEVEKDAYDQIGGKSAAVGPLKAIAWFLDKHPAGEYNRNRLAERLRAEGIDSWERKARSHKAAQGGALWVNYYRAMVEIYNHRLPEDKKLPWRLSGLSKGIGPGQQGADHRRGTDSEGRADFSSAGGSGDK